MVYKFTCFLLFVSLLGCQSDSGSSSSSSAQAFKEPSYKYFAYVLNYNDNTISGFSVDEKTGALSVTEVSSAGEGGNPITIASDPEGEKLYVGKGVDFLNNHSNLQIFSLNKNNGSLSPFQDLRVETPSENKTGYHLSSIVFPSKSLVYLSINNELRSYSVSSYTGKLSHKNSYGLGGPSAQSFMHPNGKIFIWGTIGGVALWPVDKGTGDIIHKGGASSMGLAPPLVLMNADGKLMFSSDFYGPGGFSSLNVYDIDENQRKISYKKIGATVYDFVSGGDISPNGKFLLISQRGGKLISSFSLNHTGDLSLLHSAPTESYPTKVKFLQNGKFALVLNKFGNSILSYSVDENSGALKQVGRAITGNDPQDLIVIRVPR